MIKVILILFVMINTTWVSAFGEEAIENIPILMYHNFTEDNGKNDGLNVTRENFEKHIHALKENGYTPITFKNLLEYIEGEDTIPEKPIIITIDDGYDNTYSIAYEVLKEYDFKATVFMISKWVDYDGFLSSSELLTMYESGLVDIQCHSKTHPSNLTTTDEVSLRYELKESKDDLEKLLNHEIYAFCYPYGYYDEELMSTLSEYGYNFAVTTNYGISEVKSNMLNLKRIRVDGNYTGEELLNKINY